MTATGYNPPGAPRRGPLAGFRILDLSSVIMGPYGSQLLADMGADVTFVETLAGGGNRGMGPGRHPEFSGISLNLLRNKKSISVNLKDPAVREAVMRIAAGSDVVMTNMRPKALRGLRMTYEDFRAVRADIVYCQAQGFRTDGPRADDPAYDDIIQAESGVADATLRADGAPRLAPTIMADKVCGMAIAHAITAALLHRERTGAGQRVEVPMADVMRAFMLVEHGAGGISDRNETAGYLRVLNRERGPQQTADGWINILPYSAAAYDALFAAGGRDDLVGDSRTRSRAIIVNAEWLYSQLRPIIATRTTGEWLAFCEANDIPVGSVATLDQLTKALDFAEHPEVGEHRVIPPPVWFSQSPCEVATPAPRVGEHTRPVLESAGLAPSEIEDLFARGVARGVPADAAE